jgi:broad specificity phosphatase PhoE
VGARLGIRADAFADLHENDRSGLPFFENRDKFRHELRQFFVMPGKRVIGEESADEAHSRFSAAIRSATASGEDLTRVVVSHGAVISLLVARANEIDPYSLWLSLDFTSFVVVSGPEFVIHEVVHPADG